MLFCAMLSSPNAFANCLSPTVVSMVSEARRGHQVFSQLYIGFVTAIFVERDSDGHFGEQRIHDTRVPQNLGRIPSVNDAQ